MKSLLHKCIYFALIFGLGACSLPDTKKDTQTAQKTDSLENQADTTQKKGFWAKVKEGAAERKAERLRKDSVEKAVKRYKSVPEMIADMHDYRAENGTYKLLSSKPLHIQIAKQGFENDKKEILEEMVKHDIVYVAFNAFARTDIEEFKITSVPVLWKNEPAGYMNQYAQTVTLKRGKVESILEKHYSHKDFGELFTRDKYGEAPSEAFKKMLYNDKGKPTLEVVFDELK